MSHRNTRVSAMLGGGGHKRSSRFSLRMTRLFVRTRKRPDPTGEDADRKKNDRAE
jgi:hypothetical protein